MKLTLANKVKLAAIPALTLAAGFSLAACGSQSAAPVAATAPAAVPPVVVNNNNNPAPAPAPAPTTVYVPVQAPPVAAPAAPAYFTSSTAVVTQFYQDINDGDYSGAWTLGGSIIGGGSYSGWVAGYDTTVSVSVGTFSPFGSNQVQASLTALQSNGVVKTYEGTYTVSGGVIVAANIVQTG